MRKFALIIVLLSVLFFAPLSFAGPKAEQYKKQNREAIAQIVRGQADEAIDHFQRYLGVHSNDLESLYGLTVAFARKGELGKAVEYAQKAVKLGLPFQRFLAGPRSLLAPLTRTPQFKQMIRKYGTELLHGPLLGSMTENSARFWVRTASEVPVQIVARDSVGNPIRSQIVCTNAAKDYTAVLTVSGLRPATRYSYQVKVNAEDVPGTWSFRTFPAKGQAASFSIGFGGGAGYTPQHERMWNTISSHNLSAFLLLGDNVYIDHPEQPEVQQYCYYRRQSRPEFRTFTATTPVYAIYDDHDFTTNDGWGGPGIDQPAWKRPVWRLFKTNWNNPYYGGGEEQPGCWFDFSIGDVDFIMLDCRYYRTNPKVKHPSMLGPAQKKWLFEKLKSSTGVFKVLVSSVPWAYGTKPGSLDTWEGFKEEREEIFSFIEKNRIEGVILLSADRHRSDAWKINRPQGYNFYEFESSKLTNLHTHSLMPGALFGYNEKCSFGILKFDTRKPDPQVSYEVRNIDNELIDKLTLQQSRLRFAEPMK